MIPLIIGIPLLLIAGLIAIIFLAGPKLPPETDAIIDDVLRGELPELITGRTGYAQSDGRDIWYESIPPSGPARGTVLLLMGMGGDGFLWPPAFLRVFVDAGYRTMRYDHRGTGMSDWFKDWDRHHPYALRDMAGDAVAVLDALGIDSAHLVGLSMGGMIAQEIAIHYPQRVASLTLMMTTGHAGDPDLPGPSSRFFINYVVVGLPLLKYRLMGGEKNLIKERVAKTVAALGAEGVDVREMAELVLYDLRHRRGINGRAILQHWMAINLSGSRYEGLKDVDAPTLVIHGTTDQLLPVEHGRKLATTIPNARGMWLQDVGHVFPPPRPAAVFGAILTHLATAPT
jgi:pimeloyl-ACP methyl ester carboxylesterase